MELEEYSPLEVIQEKVRIQDNVDLIKNATGAMKNHLEHIKYLKPLLNYLHKKQLQQLKYKMTAESGFAVRVTLWDIKSNAFQSTKTQPSDETIKHLLHLLILAECIERVGFDELSKGQKNVYHTYTTVIFQSLNMVYRINDLSQAKFELLKGLKDKDLNYTIVGLMFDESTANRVFKEFTPHNEHYVIADNAMSDVVNYIKQNKVVALEDVSAWQDKQFLKPYDPQRHWVKIGNHEKMYSDVYKGLNDWNYWGSYKIKIVKNSQAKNRIEGLHGNKLVFEVKK